METWKFRGSVESCNNITRRSTISTPGPSWRIKLPIRTLRRTAHILQRKRNRVSVESNMTPCEVCSKQVYLKKTSGNSDLISAQRRHEVSSDGRVIRREPGLQTQQTWCSCRSSSSTCFTRRSQPETASGSQQLLFKDSVSFGIVSCYTKMTGAEKHAGSCSSEQKTDPFMRRFLVTTQSGAFRYLMEV